MTSQPIQIGYVTDWINSMGKGMDSTEMKPSVVGEVFRQFRADNHHSVNYQQVFSQIK